MLSWIQTLNKKWIPIEERERRAAEKLQQEANLAAATSTEGAEGTKSAADETVKVVVVDVKKEEEEKKEDQKDKNEKKKKKKKNDDEEEETPPVTMTCLQCDHLLMLFDWLFDPIICFVAKAVRTQISSIDQTLVNAMIRLQQSLYNEQWSNYLNSSDIHNEDGSMTEGFEEKCLPIESLECYFMFSLIWCIGVTIDDDGRPDFNVFMKNFLNSGIDCLEDFKTVQTALMVSKSSEESVHRVYGSTVVIVIVIFIS